MSFSTGIEQPIENFKFRKDRNKYIKRCRNCISLKDKKYNEEHKKEKREYNEKHKEKQKKYFEKYYEEHQEKKKKYDKTPKRKYSRYKHGAKQRKIKFELTFEEFMIFWQKPCYYCDISIETIGLDRVSDDKEIGYTIKNLVSCCAECNYAKLNGSQKEYISRCIRVANKFNNLLIQSSKIESCQG